MRIAVDARPLTHPTTGIGRYLSSLLPLIARSEHEWLLYSHCAVQVPVGLSSVRVRHGHSHRNNLSTLFAQSRFPAWAHEDSVDLFWSPRHHLPLRLKRIPMVVTVHDLVWRRAPETMIGLGRVVEQLLMPRALQEARAILTPSKATADDIAYFYPSVAHKLHITPLAAAVPATAGESRGVSPCEEPYLLFVGTLEPRKNLGRVVQAFANLINAGLHPHRLVIAGNPGWKSGALMRRIAFSDIRDRVVFLGQVSDEQLQSLYLGCEFLVAPSLYEGFGLQVMEALSCGKPVITSNVSSLPEIAGQAAILVDPCSVSEITLAMSRLCESEALRVELGRRAREQAARYRWEMTAESTIAVFEAAAT